jgi:TrmH family RNA methyltransferase
MGAQFVLPVQEHENLPLDAPRLGARLIACIAAGSISLFEADLAGDVAFIIGGEGAGISPNLLSQTEQQLRIPMRDGVESLNAAQAATVCFYEWLRRSRDAST